MEKAVAFPCSYKTVRTDHPFVKKLQDTAVILIESRKEGVVTDEYFRITQC